MLAAKLGPLKLMFATKMTDIVYPLKLDVSEINLAADEKQVEVIQRIVDVEPEKEGEAGAEKETKKVKTVVTELRESGISAVRNSILIATITGRLTDLTAKNCNLNTRLLNSWGSLSLTKLDISNNNLSDEDMRFILFHLSSSYTIALGPRNQHLVESEMPGFMAGKRVVPTPEDFIGTWTKNYIGMHLEKPVLVLFVNDPSFAPALDFKTPVGSKELIVVCVSGENEAYLYNPREKSPADKLVKLGKIASVADSVKHYTVAKRCTAPGGPSVRSILPAEVAARTGSASVTVFAPAAGGAGFSGLDASLLAGASTGMAKGPAGTSGRVATRDRSAEISPTGVNYGELSSGNDKKSGWCCGC